MEQTSKIIIKKYPNRRLYNTQTSTYIRLDDLAAMVKKDEEFTVIDVKTNEDITRLTLVQIILDHETKGYELMPEDFIKQMIKFYDHPLNRLMQNYILQAIRSFNASLLNAPPLGQAANFSKDLEKLAKKNLDYFNKMLFGESNTKSRK